VDEQDRKQWLEVLRTTPSRLKALLKGVPRSVALWAPAPGKWSILEIACHMRDMEREAYLARYERILAEDEPRLPDVDGDAYSLELDCRAEALVPVLREWTRLRRESLRLLSRVKGPEWDRAGVHETAGRLSMADFLRRHAIGNDEAHLGQIEAIKRRHALLARLKGVPARLAKALRALSTEAVRRLPEPGKWAPIEIACHLRDADRVYPERVSKMAFSDRPTMWMTDNARLAEKLRYREADPRAVMKEHRRRREDLVSLLRALPHGAWQPTGIHPKRGELTIEALAGLVADHDDGHLSRIEAQARS
jgi:DinB family protein